jgi:hypothetical protein
MNTIPQPPGGGPLAEPVARTDRALHPQAAAPVPPRVIHLTVSASKTRCGLDTWAPGINASVLTVDPAKVTCPDCQPKKYWQDPAENPPPPQTAGDAATEAAARVREIAAAEPPKGLQLVDLALWYADRLGEMRWHALTLADAVDPPGAAR